MKNIAYFFLVISFIGCSNKIVQSNSIDINNNNLIKKESVKIQKTAEEKGKSEPEKYNDEKLKLRQYILDEMGLSKPVSLREISDKLTDDKRKNITSICIYNGENITRLNGIELFPALESLDIYNSKIKNINDIQRRYLNLKSLFIESNEMEDISNIIYLENLVTLYLSGSEKIKYFPDITHLKKLRALSLDKCKEINFNNLAEKLPLGIQMIGLNNCNIKSINEITKLFNKNVKRFDLKSNLINEINFNMDFGAATYIYMAGCPVGDKYFSWEKPGSEEYPGYVRNEKGVLFDFGPFRNESWVIEE